jgi:hypothetical protein
MPTDRKAYMRKFMADKRAKAKAAQQESKGLVEPTTSPQVAPQAPIAADLSPLTLNTLPNPPRPRPSFLTGHPDGTVEFADGQSGKSIHALTLAQKIAVGLAAPDDDCMTCGHDRQTTHPEGGKCGHGCLCRRFRPAGTDLVPCHLCGHDEFHGHAATPCDQWMGKYPCGCPSFIDPAELF